MTQQKHIPELRFPEFQGEWEKMKLEKLCSHFKSGFGITSENIFEIGDYPVYGGNGLRGYSNTYTHEGQFLLIGRQGALCGNINKVDGKSYISEHAIAVSGNENSDTEWLAQRLDYLNLNRLSESSAQPGLAVNKLLKLKLIVPSKIEQTHIASFLTAVDQRITLLTQQKEALEQYKKGVMQQLFSQQLRFKDENGNDFPDWEEKKLGNLADIKKGEQLNSSELTISGEYPCQNGGIAPSGFTDKFNTENDTITISEGGNSCGYVNYIKTKFWCGGHCYSILNIKANVYKLFLFQCLKFYETQIMKLRVGSGLPNIQKRDILYLKIKTPTYTEQQKIASFLSSIDAKIEQVSQQIEQSKTWKKGLLQKMFV